MKRTIHEVRYKYFEEGKVLSLEDRDKGIDILIEEIRKQGFCVYEHPTRTGINRFTPFTDPEYLSNVNSGEIASNYISIWRENIDPRKLPKLENFLENFNFNNLKGGEV